MGMGMGMEMGMEMEMTGIRMGGMAIMNILQFVSQHEKGQLLVQKLPGSE